MVYLHEIDSAQPFWAYVRSDPSRLVPASLTELAATGRRCVVSVEDARAFAFLRDECQFRDDEISPNVRMPVEAVDFDGHPVAV